MHIAVCDDNIADRKQMERLLKRESDRRTASAGVFYIDSFGNAQAFLHNPMLYDVFYVDVCKTEGSTGADVAAALVAKGVNKPIVLCCSGIDYRQSALPDNILFLDKPIKAAELSASLDHALAIQANAPPLIELRQEKDTIYVTEPEILYATEEGRSLHITLADGRRISIASSAENFFCQVESYPVFFSPTARTILNGRHIEALRRNKAVMTDQRVFKISRQVVGYARQLLEDR
ncbi:MAG: hypothetical protein LBQ15_00560 [Clostridium sp.]|nr:hypothetical protein [Clostridium sp.]